MQTFLPYSDFTKTAKVLDYRRLGKQRIEAKQILMILRGETTSNAWKNHPAVKMWSGYESALAMYGFVICKEWIARGYVDNQLSFFIDRFDPNTFEMPKWMGDVKFHKSHKSNLIRKSPEYYKKHFRNVPDNLPYIWPQQS